MKASDLIYAFLLDALAEQDGAVELQRNELAQRFHVVPSQINYVISSRFSPEQGYLIESRRGGGGYIRIRRVENEKSLHFMHVVNGIGDRLNLRDADLFLQNLYDYGMLSETQADLMKAALSDRALSGLGAEEKEIARAGILKNMLLSIAD